MAVIPPDTAIDLSTPQQLPTPTLPTHQQQSSSIILPSPLLSEETSPYIVFLIWAAIASGLEDRPQVKIPQGQLLGKYLSSRNNQSFSAYLKIPYGQPPVGDLRLQSPVKALSWDGVRDAGSDGPLCVQPNMKKDNFGVIGEEDCLYINVYTPDGARSKGKTYPVMVFVHGGAMLFGSSGAKFLGPEYILDKDVVLVTFNYRLGLLGFLTAEDEVIPGNYGLKDQVLALKWVQENIKYFGGNPDNVTLFGESAGSVSVAFHLLAKSSQGLFHRVISESGTSLNFWSLGNKGVKAQEAKNFAGDVNCPSHENSTALLECLRKLDAKQFFYNPFKDFLRLFNYLPYNMGIVLEKETVPDAFITENPWDLINQPNDTPWIVGINSGEFGGALEGIYKSQLNMITDVDRNYRIYFPKILSYPLYLFDATDKIRQYYFHDKPLNESFLEFTQLMTDRAFIIPAINSALLYKGPKYFYEYGHVNQFRKDAQKNGLGIDYGAAHADEVPSLFYVESQTPNGLAGNDLKVSEQMVEYWTNFAIYGQPNGPDMKLPKWKQTDSSLEYLFIKDGDLSMKSGLRQEQFDFWNNLPIKHNF